MPLGVSISYPRFFEHSCTNFHLALPFSILQISRAFLPASSSLGASNLVLLFVISPFW